MVHFLMTQNTATEQAKDRSVLGQFFMPYIVCPYNIISDCTERYCHVIHGYPVTCRKTRWISRKNSSRVAQQADTPGGPRTFVARHESFVAHEVTVYVTVIYADATIHS